MIIAVTDSDEANMLACQVAASLFHTPTKIARIRSPHYLIRKELFDKNHLPIDLFISPEQLVTNYVRELIDHPGALQVLDFAQGKVKLLAVKPHYGGPLVSKRLAEIPHYIPDVPLRVVAIFRNDRSIPLSGDTTIEIGDEVFFIAASEHVHAVMAAFRQAQDPYKRIMIAGGGHIGSCLAEAMENDYQVKLIELDRKRCENLAARLTHTTVLHGEASDKNLLLSENIEHLDVFCAVTNDDEANILACLQAKRLGVKQVMALITRTAYVDLIEGGSINIAISPQQATIGFILTQIRRGDAVSVHSLRRGAAEAIELIAHGEQKTSRVVGRAVKELKLPGGVTIGAIVREGEVIIAQNELRIAAEDHVILFMADKRSIKDVEKLFQVGATFF
jgi:trk system potassium uptake protein TrkA